jgi:sec-independent protein translocase protein TatC
MKQKAKAKTKKPTRRNTLGEMSLLEHLDELRRRFVIIVIALLVGTLIGAIFTQQALSILIEPAKAAGVELQFITPTEAPATFFKVAFVLGVVIAMPVILYQVFMYLSPGLLPNERLYIAVGIPFASLSFAGGVAFAALVALPNAIAFLGNFMSEVANHDYSADYYLTFVGNVMLWSGLVFETPLVMFILSRLGIVSPQSFAKVRRFVIVGAAVGAAIVTPTPDPLNMMLIMGPFLLLYEFGILLARLAQIGREKAEQTS